MSILVTRSSMPDLDEYLKMIESIFTSRWLTNMGPLHQELQKQVSDFLQVPYVSLFVNGHSALEIAYQALDFPEGSEVITTPFTFVSTVNAIVRSGLKPVFCDIKNDDYTLDPAKIENLINENTVAISPVHVYGNVCDVEAIEDIANRYNLKIIYDSAHAFGVQYKGKGIGSFGDISMFSFHATKVFHTIEGGCLTFRDKNLVNIFDRLKDFGLDSSADVSYFAGNAKMDEFRAAMGLCNIKNIDEYIKNRKLAYERYDEKLENISGLQLNKEQKLVKKNYAYYPVCVNPNKFGKSRDEILDRLASRGIFGRKYFYPAINDMKVYINTYGSSNTPIAKSISKNIMCLPLYDGISVNQVDNICDLILG